MSETIAATEPTAPPHSADFLLILLVTLLAPMFLAVSGGNIALARTAALETINGYQARSHADLLTVALIIAFGLAALGSLSLSLLDDVSISMALRLRGNANALNRSIEQNRRALGKIEPVAPSAPLSTPAQPEANEAEIVADVAKALDMAAEAKIRLQQAGKTEAANEEVQQTFWAAAIADIAAECIASLPGLAQADRREAVQRAATLSRTAMGIFSGESVPTFPTSLPFDPRQLRPRQ